VRKDNPSIAGLIVIPAISKSRFPSSGKAITLAIVVVDITVVDIVTIILTDLLVYFNYYGNFSIYDNEYGLIDKNVIDF
jgi:hypothetical protein